MTEPNVFNFQRDCGFYLNLSKKSRDRGDLLGAIDYAKRARAAEDNEEVSLELARLYMDANYYDKVLDVINSVIAKNHRCVEAYSLAFRFFLLLDDVFSLLSYIKLGLEYNQTNPEFFRALDEVRREFDFEKLLSDAQNEGYRVIYPEKQDGRERETGLSDDGEFLLTETRNLLAQSALDAGEYRDAENYLSDVLGEEPENISALCSMVYACNSAGEYDKADEYVRKLSAMQNVTDVNDVYKIVSVFCDMNLHELILSYLVHVEELITPDDRLLEMKAIALYNLEKLKESAEIFRQLHVVDDTFGIYQYYLKRIDQIVGGERPFEILSYSDQVPEPEYQFRSRKLELILSLGQTEFLECLKIPENEDLLKWSLTMNEDGLVAEVVKRMFASPLESFLTGMLVYSDISYMVKKEVIALRLFRGDREISYSISDVIRIRKSKYMKRYSELNETFRRSYCMAQAVLYFTDSNYFAKLSARCGRMFDRWKLTLDPDLANENALTAAMLYLAMRDQYPVEVLSRIFVIGETELLRYIEAYQ